MTKAEAWITEERDTPWKLIGTQVAKRHDDREYFIRLFEAEIDGSHYTLSCDGYYGYSRLTKDGRDLGEYEYRYEDIPR